MHTNLLKKLFLFNDERNLFVPGEKIGLAVSGGLDSIVMFDLFRQCASRRQLELIVLHFNHQLRPESKSDADFVAALCKEHHIAFVYDEADVASFAKQHKLSIETAARNCRYDFFEKSVNTYQLDKIATAHTANDQAETILAHIMRGSGIIGLRGIPVKRGAIIRPLLFAERKVLERYANKQSLKWREDATNRDESYSRNRIRHTLLPLLQEKFNPKIVDALNRLSESMVDSELVIQKAGLEAFNACAQQDDDRKIVLEIDCFFTYLKSLQRLILRHVFEELGSDPHILSFHKLAGILAFLQKRVSGSSFHVHKDLSIVVSDNKAVFGSFTDDEHCVPIEINQGRYDLWNDFFLEIMEMPKPLTLRSKNKDSEYIDADLLKTPCVVRSIKNADFFYPVNGAGRRKISDFFIDQKTPFYDRTRVPILASGRDIVWICGFRMDDRFKITENTKRVFKITIGKRER